jgi:hypothetical protein
MRGLGPRIQLFCEEDGSPGQAWSSPALTIKIQFEREPL